MSLRIDEINRLDKAEITDFVRSLKPSELMDSRKEVVSLIEDYLMLSYVYGVKEANKELGIDLVADTEELNASLEKRFDGLTCKDRLNNHLEMGDVNGVLRVLYTEEHRVFNEGQFNTALNGGATEKTWVTEMNGRVRDTHDYLEGMTVGINDYFYTYTGERTLYPGQFGVPEEDVNCRCSLKYK